MTERELQAKRMNTEPTTQLLASPPLVDAAGSVVDLAKRIPFRMVSHLNCSNEHVLEYLNEPLNLACVIVTPYRHGSPGKGVKTFGINERKAKGYKTLAALLVANPKILWRAVLLYPPNTKLSGGGPLSNKTTEAESHRPLE